jgi:regulatory protein
VVSRRTRDGSGSGSGRRTRFDRRDAATDRREAGTDRLGAGTAPHGAGESAGQRTPAPPDDPVQRAKDLCLRLLTARPRTSAELHRELVRRGFDDDVAEQVLGRLDDVGLVDDAAFAEVWVRSRHTYQGLGRRALVAELRRKGVDESLAAEAAATLDDDAEEERARQLVRKRLRAVGGADEAARIRRLAGMLARKGYSPGLAFRVVRDELRRAGEDTGLLDDTTLD